MSTSCATVRTECLNSVGNRLAVPARINHFSKFPIQPCIVSISLFIFFDKLKRFVLFEGGKCELNRRNFALNGIVAAGASVMTPSVVAEPSKG